jgi:hypothetical protein
MSGVCKRSDENGNMDLILTTSGAVEAIILLCIALLVALGAFVAFT